MVSRKKLPFGHLGCFYVLPIGNSGALNIYVLFGHFFLIPLSTYSGVELLGHMALSFLTSPRVYLTLSASVLQCHAIFSI